MIKIRDGIEKYLEDNGYRSVSEICGKVIPYESGII
jgi:dihydroorotate dehydrogenase (NAD+) catalytic subunit